MVWCGELAPSFRAGVLAGLIVKSTQIKAINSEARKMFTALFAVSYRKMNLLWV